MVCVGRFLFGTLWVCIRGPSLGSVWICLGRSLCGVLGGPVLDQCVYVGVPVWGRVGLCGGLHGDPPLLSLSLPPAGEGQGLSHLLSYCSNRSPLVFSHTGTLVSRIPSSRAHLWPLKEDLRSQAGSRIQLSVLPSCELLWRIPKITAPSPPRP